MPQSPVETKYKVCGSASCSHGDEPQPISNFYVHTRNPDGSVRLWQSRCRDCMREENRTRAARRRRASGVSPRPEPYRIKGGVRDSLPFNKGLDAVDAAPFQGWLKDWLANPDHTIKQLASMSDVSERAIGVMRKQERVSLYKVDVVLTAAGVPLSLVYPEH